MSVQSSYDAITVDELRSRGSRKWSEPGQDCLGAWVAEEDFGTAPAVHAALEDVAARGLYGYLPDWLAADLRAAFTDFLHRRYAWDVPTERVAVAPDVLAGLEHLLRRIDPSAAVLVPTPAYMPFLDTPRRLGRRVIQVPHTRGADGRDELDLEAMDAVMRTEHVGLVILCNPHNPTGRVLTREELQAFDRLMEAHPDVWVFSDEIHAPVVLAGASHLPYASLSPAAAARTLTATSTSKAFGLPGLKCAQLVLPAGHTEDPDELERLLRLAATPGVAAAIAAYTDGDTWLQDFLDYLACTSELLVQLVAEHLPGAELRAPEGTYVAWLDCSGLDLPEDPAAFFLREAGVALSAGGACGEGYEQHVRLVYATPRPVLRSMITAMGAAVRSVHAPAH